MLLLVASGICIGFIMDIIRILRTPIKNKIIRNILDLGFICASGIIVLYASYITSSMTWEITRIVVLAAGIGMYYLGPTHFVRKISPIINRLAGKIKASKLYKFITK